LANARKGAFPVRSMREKEEKNSTKTGKREGEKEGEWRAAIIAHENVSVSWEKKRRARMPTTGNEGGKNKLHLLRTASGRTRTILSTEGRGGSNLALLGKKGGDPLAPRRKGQVSSEKKRKKKAGRSSPGEEKRKGRSAGSRRGRKCDAVHQQGRKRQIKGASLQEEKGEASERKHGVAVFSALSKG